MADIVLLDKNGESLNCGSAKHVSIPTDTDENIIYTDMSQLRVYYGTLEQIESGEYTFTVQSIWVLQRGAGFVYALANDVYPHVLFTTKELQVGQTYLSTDLGGI